MSKKVKAMLKKMKLMGGDPMDVDNDDGDDPMGRAPGDNRGGRRRRRHTRRHRRSRRRHAGMFA
jgi:hypothetical protein